MVHFANALAALSREEKMQLFHQQPYMLQWYLNVARITNAVTEYGELYNVDGTGNRVAAMIFGPKQVIIVAGLNKIVTDLHAAVDRLETVASPANCVRLGRNTPCAKTGRCGHCLSPDRICNDYVIMAHQRDKDRIKVIFIADEFGY